MFRSSKLGCTFVVLVLNLAFTTAQQVRWLGSLPGFSASYATGVSLNGRAVCGNLYGWGLGTRACVWIDYQPELLPTPDGAISVAESISGDGNTVVGYILSNTFHAVYWRRQRVGSFQMYYISTDSVATDVSSDGRVIVGWTENNYGFVWKDGHCTFFRVFDRPTVVWGVSPNGYHIVGIYPVYDPCTDNYQNRGFMANTSLLTNPLDLPSLNDGFLGGVYCLFDSYPFAVSNNGLAAGTSSLDRALVATKWFPVRQIGTHQAGDVDVNSYAYDVTSDGTIAVGGHDGYPDVGRAVRWRDGIEENLNIVYLPRPCGSRLEIAMSIPYDGRYIVGSGGRPGSNLSSEAYILDTAKPPLIGDLNGDGCIDGADLLMVLLNLGTYNPDADVNCDGVVDDSDLLAILSNLGLGCE